VTEQDPQGRGALARAPLPTRRTAGSAAGPPGTPPTAARTARRRLRLRRALAVVAGLLVLALFSVVGAYSYYDSRLTRISIPGLGHMFGSPASAPTAVGENFLLVGSDTRAFAGGQAFQAPAASADFVAGARSDTVILLHLPIGGAKPTIVSFPRDTYVHIPAFTDRDGKTTAAHPAKLNEAFSIGGPALLTQLIEQLTGGAAAGQPLTVAPAAIALEVRNGTSTAGLAGRVARSLRRHGYTVTATGSVPAVDQTAVRYRPDMLAAARTVAAALPGAQLQVDPTLPVGVQLVLGPGAPAVVRVHLGPSATPTPSASAPPAPASPVPAAAPAGACAP